MKEQRSPDEEKSLENLYQSKAGTDDHQIHEQQYNDIRKQRLEQEGRGEEFRYQKDVRHEFEYGEGSARTKEGCQLRKSDEVINWRNTEVGAKADKKACQDVSRNTGDDAGHMISPEFGADPGDKRNIARQNYLQNEGGGTWHKEEQRIKDDVNKNGKQMGMSVEMQSNPDKYGDRPYNRKLGTWEQDANGKTVPGTKQSVAYGNFSAEEVRARDAGTYQKGQSQEMRKEGFDQQREIRANQNTPETKQDQAEWNKMKEARENKGSLTTEERQDLKTKMNDRVAGGTEAKRDKER